MHLFFVLISQVFFAVKQVYCPDGGGGEYPFISMSGLRKTLNVADLFPTFHLFFTNGTPDPILQAGCMRFTFTARTLRPEMKLGRRKLRAFTKSVEYVNAAALRRKRNFLSASSCLFYLIPARPLCGVLLNR